MRLQVKTLLKLQVQDKKEEPIVGNKMTHDLLYCKTTAPLSIDQVLGVWIFGLFWVSDWI